MLNVKIIQQKPPKIILGEPSFGKLIDEYLHDFDIFHLAHATELLHYIDSKYLSVELGGNRPVDMNTWMVVQQNVDAFTLRFGIGKISSFFVTNSCLLQCN